MAGNSRNELLEEENEEDKADGSQDEVVDQEQSLELEGFSVAHPLATTKDDGVVDDGKDEGFF